MTTPIPEVDALAAKLAAAEGPSRELDAAIGLACGQFKASHGNKTLWDMRETPARLMVSGDRPMPNPAEQLATCLSVPLYTSSTDAALSFVPKFPGRNVRITIIIEDPEKDDADVDFEEWIDTGPHVETRSIASGSGPLALAICRANVIAHSGATKEQERK